MSSCKPMRRIRLHAFNVTIIPIPISSKSLIINENERNEIKNKLEYLTTIPQFNENLCSGAFDALSSKNKV